jgi:hypothetical protein
VVNQHCQFCFRLVPRQPGELDLLKRLGCRQGGNPLRRTCWFRWRLVLPTRPPMSDPWTRPALRLAHGIQHAAQVGQLRPSLTWSPKARDWTHPPLESCELHHIIPGWRSLTDGDGQLRTLPPLRRHAGGVCTVLILATLWMQEPTERRRRCRAECPGHRQYQERLSGVDEEPAHDLRGLFPAKFAPSHGHRPIPATCLTGASRGRLFCAHHRGQCRPTNRPDSRDESSPAWFPHHPEGESPWTIGCAG